VKPSDPRLLAVARERAAENNYWRHLKIEVTDAGVGWIRLRIPVRDEIRNADGAPVHGGAIASLLDAAVGGALSTLHEASEGGTGQVTLDLNITYLGPAREGEVYAEGRIIRKGRTIAFGEADIRDRDGEVIAKGRVTYFVR
jgi:acyl-CoA thioesterase